MLTIPNSEKRRKDITACVYEAIYKDFKMELQFLYVFFYKKLLFVFEYNLLGMYLYRPETTSEQSIIFLR